ncbi:MAG: poly(R)-hydroxyalkanoic acid synthase subunit PhaE [Pseudomonadota bacterium]
MAQQDGDAFTRMAEMWAEGGKAMMDAQAHAAEQFRDAMSGNLNPPGAVGGDDLVDTWRELMAAWMPGYQDGSGAAPIRSDTIWNGKGGDFFSQMMNPMAMTMPAFSQMDMSKAAPFTMDAWANFAPEQLRDILDSVAQGPRFADLAAPWMDAAQTSREWLDYQRAAMEFANVLRNAWGRAYATYAQDWSLDDLKTGDVDGALQAWLKVANAELLSTQRTSEYLDAQKNLLRAGLDVKARMNEAAEQWAEAWQMPTRSEVDDMAKQLHDLRSTVRRLKREMKDLATAQGVEPKKPPRRTSASARKGKGKSAAEKGAV